MPYDALETVIRPIYWSPVFCMTCELPLITSNEGCCAISGSVVGALKRAVNRALELYDAIQRRVLALDRIL
jgi:hypothetical protein